jgi:hypothetical protein
MSLGTNFEDVNANDCRHTYYRGVMGHREPERSKIGAGGEIEIFLFGNVKTCDRAFS